MEKQENLLTVVREDGTEELCEILFTYHSDEFEKDYVVLHPVGTEELSAAIIIQEEEGGQLIPIESDEEWDMIEKVIEQFYEDMEGCDCEDDCECEDDCGCEDEKCECHHK